MTKREVVGRYRGSIFGLFWSFFNPIVMLLVYTFVFGVVFKARWPGGMATQREFAVIVFTGLTVFTLFAELTNRAPSLIVSNVNYVKRVVFPLEILPCIALGTSLFHTCISLLILLTAHLVLNGILHWTFVFFPFVLLPLIAVCLGLAWFLASLGTFVRDVGQMVGVVTQILMFLSPVFYPPAAIPSPLRPILKLNPLAFIMEQMREIIIYGHLPSWVGLAMHLGLGILVAWTGLCWFQKTRNGFANVL